MTRKAGRNQGHSAVLALKPVHAPMPRACERAPWRPTGPARSTCRRHGRRRRSRTAHTHSVRKTGGEQACAIVRHLGDGDLFLRARTAEVTATVSAVVVSARRRRRALGFRAPAKPRPADSHTRRGTRAGCLRARPARSDLYTPPEESELLGAAEAPLRVAPCGRGLHSRPSRAPSALTGTGD